MATVYYMGIGPGGYGVYYDDEKGKEILVSRLFATFSQARIELTKYLNLVDKG